MIACPTTFVVGAGASCAHGLPTGSELLKQARGLNADSPVFQLLHQSGVSLERLQRFIARITPTTVRSIDSFLEKRQLEPEIISTGKAVIAGLLGESIHNGRKRKQTNGEDWIFQVIDHMHQGVADWPAFAKRNSPVRFVTFNFDSIIEDRLAEIVRGIFDNPSPTAEQIAEVLPVIHVHGQLPPVPSDALFSDSIQPFPAKWIQWVKDAQKTIRIAYEDGPYTQALPAQDAVRCAHVLCFLGFGYDRGNLERIGLPDAFGVLPPNSATSPAVFGSAVGLSPGFQQEVKTRLRGLITLASSDHACEQVIAEHHILRG